MPPTLPPLPAHSHDPALAQELLTAIASQVSEHQCDLRPDHLYIPEHDLVLRARASISDANNSIESYIWAEHDRWPKPAAAFMFGHGDSRNAAIDSVAENWANGPQSAICQLFHNPRKPRLSFISYPSDEPDRALPWRGTASGVYGFVASAPAESALELYPEAFFLDALGSSIADRLAARELISLLAVYTLCGTEADSTVYFDGFVDADASAALAATTPPPIHQNTPIVCQKIYILLEPCEWDEVDRDKFPTPRGEAAPASPRSRSWWQRLIGR